MVPDLETPNLGDEWRDANPWTHFSFPPLSSMAIKANPSRSGTGGGGVRRLWHIPGQDVGLFCINFASWRKTWPPCCQVWCGSCYTPHPQDKFFHFKPTDESGFEWKPKVEENHFRCARPSDHLLITVQCDLCSFWNLFD